MTRKSDATTCLSRRPCRARSTRPTATCHGVGKMRLPLMTTATCQIANSTATGPSSGSHAGYRATWMSTGRAARWKLSST